MTTFRIHSSDDAHGRSLNLSQIVEMTGGELFQLVSDHSPDGDSVDEGESGSVATIRCDGAAPPTEAKTGDVTMVDGIKHVNVLRTSLASVVITPERLTAQLLEMERPAWQIVVADPHAAFSTIILHFRPPLDENVPGTGIHSSAKIHATAQISPAASIGAGVRIGPGCRVHAGVSVAAGCRIGANCVLHPNVTLYSYCRLGDRVTLHAGTVIGANGFGYKQVAGKHVPTAQLGYVQIDNDVEVGAAVTIDRGTYGATLIGEGTKIDNQVMIAHNCRIGRHNLLCSQVGIAGSCTTGDYVILAGQVGLKDHIHLADGTIVAAQAGVMDDLAAGVYLGSPARPQREQMQIFAVQRKLPELRRDVKTLQKQVVALAEQLAPEEGSTPSIKAA